MSQQHVEIVRKAVDAWNRRDADLWADYAAAEVEWTPAGPAAVEGTVYRGYEDVARGLESVWQTWDRVRFEESELRDLDDAVLWLGRLKLRGAASQVELDQEFAVRFRAARRQARHCAGLSLLARGAENGGRGAIGARRAFLCRHLQGMQRCGGDGQPQQAFLRPSKGAAPG